MPGLGAEPRGNRQSIRRGRHTADRRRRPGRRHEQCRHGSDRRTLYAQKCSRWGRAAGILPGIRPGREEGRRRPHGLRAQSERAGDRIGRSNRYAEDGQAYLYRSHRPAPGLGCQTGRHQRNQPRSRRPLGRRVGAECLRNLRRRTQNPHPRRHVDLRRLQAAMGGRRRDHGGRDQRRRQLPVVGRRYDAHQLGHRRTQRRRHREFPDSQGRLGDLDLRRPRHGRRHRHHHEERHARRYEGQLHRRIHDAHDAQLLELQHHELAGADGRLPGDVRQRLAQLRQHRVPLRERRLRQVVATDQHLRSRHGAVRRAEHPRRAQRLPAAGRIPQHRLV